MGLVERNQMIERISPPLDHLLATQLVDEFVSQEHRYIQREWEPAELDGGQFCEVLARIIYHQDSGNLNRDKEFEDCAKYILNDKVPHARPRQEMLLLLQVLKTIYKFRSKRGAVHVSSTYKANHMDARMMIENVRWAMNETLRTFWQGDPEAVAKAIRELLQFDVPCIGVFGSVVLVQRTDLTPEEEVLVLLHYGGEAGLTRTDVGRYAQCSPASVSRSLQTLTAPDCREVVALTGGRYRLSDLGSRRIRDQLADKLLLQ
jgi:hypothetical protein